MIVRSWYSPGYSLLLPMCVSSHDFYGDLPKDFDPLVGVLSIGHRDNLTAWPDV